MSQPVPALCRLSFRSPETSLKQFEGLNAAACHEASLCRNLRVLKAERSEFPQQRRRTRENPAAPSQ